MSYLSRILTAAIVLVAMTAPTPVLAASKVAPPGNSGVDQYLEVVPSAAGGRKPPQDRPREALAPRVQKALDRQGADGRALGLLAQATAPAAARRAGHRPAKAKRRPSAAASAPHASDGSSVLSSAASALHAGSDSGGMGFLLPLVLVASACMLGALALLRRRA